MGDRSGGDLEICGLWCGGLGSDGGYGVMVIFLVINPFTTFQLEVLAVS